MPVIDRSKVPNAFQFVTVASARARQLLAGAPPRVENASPNRKKARIAAAEVLEGAVRPLDDETTAG
jgi:DNA-directed RNA polymerase subunit K/omega